MKQSSELAEKFSWYTFLLFVATITLPDRVGIYTLNLWFLGFLVDLFVNIRFNKFSIKGYNITYLLVFLLFISGIYGALISQNTQGVGRMIETRLSLLIIPFIGILGINPKFNANTMVKTFIGGIAGSFLLMTILSASKIVAIPWEHALYVKDFPEFFIQIIGKHKSYWSSFLYIAIFLQLNVILYTNTSKNKIFQISIALFLIALLLVFEARIIFLSFIIGGGFLVLLLPAEILKTKFKLIAGAALFASIIAIFFVSSRVQSFFYKEKSLIENIRTYEPRFKIWEAASEIIAENGYKALGTGDLQLALDKQYEAKGMIVENALSFNSHNSFLQLWMESGIISAILLLIIIFIPIYFARNSNKLGFVIAISIMLFLFALFEVVLNRISGILLIAIYPLIIEIWLRNDSHEINKMQPKLDYYVGGMLALSAVILLVLYTTKPEVDYRIPKTFVSEPFDNITNDLPDSLNKKEIKAFIYRPNEINKAITQTSSFFNVLTNKNLSINDSIFTSIYCKVSKDFSGDMVALAIGDPLNMYNYIQYPLQQKGEWILLQGGMRITTRNDVNVFVSIHDFEKESIKGEVYFALPDIKVVKLLVNQTQ